ncbi:MAG: phosphoesterase PA-phosphatase, partial [Ferruginibacter sp.]
MRLVIFTIAAACMLSACNTKNDYKQIIHDPLLFSNTVHKLNEVVMGNNFSPIVASRNYAYASIAAYEVI